MVLVLMLKLKELGLPLPGAVVALSPWGDLGGRGESFYAKGAVDATLDPDTLLKAACQYTAEENWGNPMVSPVFGDFTGGAPTLIQCTSDEILLSDSQNLYWLLRQQGVEVTLEVWNGLWHVFQCYPIAEAKGAIAEIARFLREKLGITKGGDRAFSKPFRTYDL